MNRLLPALIFCCLIAPAFAADDPTIIFDMDTLRHKPTEITNKDKQKIPTGTAELVDGKFNKAVKFTFVENSSGGFMTAAVRPTPLWDQSAGFSFWVKGDGSKSFGGIEVIDKSDFKLRYGYCFPIDSTDWQKITVPWHDLIPELSAPPIDPKNGYAPSNFGNFWFGKWFYYRDYPAHSYSIDQVVLEKKIDEPPLPDSPPRLTRLRAKLAAHKPITIVTMADSLTDTHHWSNRTTNWPALLAAAIKDKYASAVKIVNPAIGGTTLSQNVILIPRWARETPHPDLVTVWFGGNDWDTGVRGERFKQYLQLAVDHIRRATDGQADILLMTTAPAHARWETYAELEKAAREVATENKLALADTAAAFHKIANADEALKQTYWAWDKVHLGRKGQETARDVIMQTIATPPQ
jgi:lysophospholipase L1-like esterase